MKILTKNSFDILKNLWYDDKGFILSTEALFLSSILVVGIVAGMTKLRDAVNLNFEATAGTIGEVSQSGRREAMVAMNNNVAINIQVNPTMTQYMSNNKNSDLDPRNYVP